jgi:AmmeMemoRadiSam system protein B
MSRYAALIVIPPLLALWGAGGDAAGAAATGGVREPVDTVGYATRPDQVELVAALSDSLIAAGLAGGQGAYPAPDSVMIGAIVPHDDYIFAGPFYTMTVGRMAADLVIMFGVAHRARRIGLEGKLIFDDFIGWRGPYGVTPVSALREKLISSLPADIVKVDGSFHASEHSLEAMIPFLQYFGRIRHDGSGLGPRILPVLVTRFPGDSFEKAAGAMIRSLSSLLRDEGMVLGRDAAVLVSADCVHYGDEAWGERGYAPYGTGREGYGKATAMDIDIAETTLGGILSRDKIAGFRERVERDDLEWPYKVTWCGVYSIPFGLSVLGGLAAAEGREAPRGFMLGYGTSLDPGRLPVEGSGLGATNINTLRHWVGYLAMGYW